MDTANCPGRAAMPSTAHKANAWTQDSVASARRMQIVPARPDAWMGFARRPLNALRMPDAFRAGYVCLEASAQESLTVEMTGLGNDIRRQRFGRPRDARTQTVRWNR